MSSSLRWGCLVWILMGCDGMVAGGNTDGGAGGSTDGGGGSTDGGGGSTDGGGGSTDGGGGSTDGGGGGNTPDAGAPDAGWTIPEAGCAVPVQDGVDVSGWPEVFVGTEGCADDADAGTRARPFCNPHRALAWVTGAGRVVTFLDGTYRLDDFANSSGGRGALRVPSVGATASAFVVLRAAPGAKPVLLGSVRASGGWTLHSSAPRVFRRPLSSTLGFDVTALYQVVDGPEAQFTRARRFRHVMEFRNGVRSHAPVSMLADGAGGQPETSMTEPTSTRDFTWTKADANGAACGDSNAGCFLYLRAEDTGFDPNAVAFELPQYAGIGGSGSFAVIDGLSTRFTQCHGQSCSLFFEGVRNVLIQNASFGHVSNSDDNSYGLALWFANGSIVRRNVVFDSAYWGGTPNSKGITFMVSGNEAPNWVCENEVFHIPGQAGISTKGGVSNLLVLGNYVHDSYIGIESSHVRTQDGTFYSAGGWLVARNRLERCGAGVSLSRNGSLEPQVGDVIANNLFIGNETGVDLSNTTPNDADVHDNIFIAPEGADTCTAQVCGSGLYFANNAAAVRDFDFLFAAPYNLRTSHNLFFGFRWTHGVNRNWTPNYINRDLPTFQAAFPGQESGSLVADPMLDSQGRPLQGSPALGAGIDGGNIGL